jgi:tetratricopeptide (TPR) repeat protein
MTNPQRASAVLAALLSTTACTTVSAPDATDYLAASPASVSDYQRGKQDLADGNYGLALTHFSDAIKRDPRNIAALNGQAITLAKLDRPDDAETAFERALAVDGQSPMTRGNYAVFLDRHGDHDRALALLDKPSVVPTMAPPADPPAAVPAAALAPKATVATLPITIPVMPSANIPVMLGDLPIGKANLTISNGSGQYRLARQLQQYLTGQGFAAGRIANAPHFDRSQSILFCHAESREAAEAIRRALPATVKLVVLTSKSDRIELVAGSDLNEFGTQLASAAPVREARR